MATLHIGEDAVPTTFSNDFLAHLQVAVSRRARSGGGFFVTGTLAGETEVTSSWWVPGSAVLRFTYDVHGDDGARRAPVAVDAGRVDELLAAMDRPSGVRLTDELWLPFVVD